MNISDYLLSHGYGTVIWTTLVFIILLVLLSKFAWTPILQAVQARDQKLAQALEQAEALQQRMEAAEAQRKEMLRVAKVESDDLLGKTKTICEQMIAKAHDQAHQKGEQLLAQAQAQITTQVQQAKHDLKQTVAELAVDIAATVVAEQLQSSERQQALIQKKIESITLH